jgi:hypothetical protein
MSTILNKFIRLTSYDLYLKVPPMSDSCSKMIGSKGKSGEAASSKDLQITSPEGPEPTMTTFIDPGENKRLRANDRSSPSQPSHSVVDLVVYYLIVIKTLATLGCSDLQHYADMIKFVRLVSRELSNSLYYVKQGLYHFFPFAHEFIT